jgi:hypothetical protein
MASPRTAVTPRRALQVDLAAKDKRCARFDADFRVELLFLPLPGQAGAGPALDAARHGAGRSLLRSKSNLSWTGSGLSRPSGGRRVSSFGIPANGPGGGSTVGDPPATAATPMAREPALHWEREGYLQFVRQLPCSQCAPPLLEDWLLGRVDDPAKVCPGGALCRGVAAAAAAAAAACAQSWSGVSSSGTAAPDNETARTPDCAAAAATETVAASHGCISTMGGESGIGWPDSVMRADWSLVPWLDGPRLPNPPHDCRFP